MHSRLCVGHAFLWHVLEQYDTLRHREQRMRGASPEPHHSQLPEDMTTVRPRRDQCCEWPRGQWCASDA